jgi:probable biosynthetic protein (TIGR04098 family)
VTRTPNVHDLTVGFPHTNYRGLSEPSLLMYAGHFQCGSIAAAIGNPLSRLRTSAGTEVYPGFYYVEERFPASTPLESFGLDDVVRFMVCLRAFRNMAVEGRIVFDRPERLADMTGVIAAIQAGASQSSFPWIRFGNIFIEPEGSNRAIRVAPPANADFSDLPPLPDEENPYHVTRPALKGRSLGVVDGNWQELSTFEYRYEIDVDRDTNGAGLVYFAHYPAFMATAERLALAHCASRIAPERVVRRSLRHRRIAYYGNVDVTDAITIRITTLVSDLNPDAVGFRYHIVRVADGETICVSEAIKATC